MEPSGSRGKQTIEMSRQEKGDGRVRAALAIPRVSWGAPVASPSAEATVLCTTAR